ncbi:hypothetical protein AB0B66_07370 [Catellatospora sp. NPDC049111]|uniref:hypothetical protein n=1 Tax=Catellatospora sp. NPDC049111 TaxID=3155271 RepID=UPI003410B6A7
MQSHSSARRWKPVWLLAGALAKGWAAATVTWGSYALTGAGWLCFSYSPTTSTTIT